ncbi:MAG: DUF3533 domain-containing protein [Slackia sp.]|nr:DUF3533 domain-containing protein [Slackia sp.]
MQDLKRKMRARVFAAPFAIGLALLCVFGIAAAPMFSASPKNVPMALVNLDEGAALPTGDSVNAGAAVVKAMTGAAEAATADGQTAPIAWTELDDQEALDEAMAAGDFYGAVVIPADFTQVQMAGRASLAAALQEGIASLSASPEQAASAALQAGAPDASQVQAAQAAAVQGIVADIEQAQQDAEKPSVDVVLNVAKNPMLAQQMQAAITGMVAQAGMQANVTAIGEADAGDSPLAAMMSVQFMVMPLCMMSIVMGAVIVAARWPRRNASRGDRVREGAIQLAYCACAAFVAAVAAYGMVAWIGGVSVGAQALLLLWLASFCLMTAMVGLCDIAMPLGALVMVSVFAFGMSTAILPVEMLPGFWADMVAPWAPQACLGDGLRGIIYLGNGAFDAGVAPLAAWMLVGLAAFAVAVALPSRKQEADAAR